jgi:AmmeMemoRadiSam system protein A
MGQAYPEQMAEPRSDGTPTPEEGAALVWLAVQTVAVRLCGGQPPTAVPGSERLRRVGASFVTLERAGRLRGCIGSLDARRPLYLDVVRNAIRAMADPRLPPVTATDWPELDVKVSVLTAPEPVPADDRDAVEALLRPGADGLVLTDGVQRATFLPSVWAKVTEPRQFVDALLAKGGWPAWPDGLRALRYASVEFADKSPREPMKLPGEPLK